MTEQKLRMYARKVVALSPPSSLQQIMKLGNILYLLPKALNSRFIVSTSLFIQKRPYLRSVHDFILRSFRSVPLNSNWMASLKYRDGNCASSFIIIIIEKTLKLVVKTHLYIRTYEDLFMRRLWYTSSIQLTSFDLLIHENLLILRDYPALNSQQSSIP